MRLLDPVCRNLFLELWEELLSFKVNHSTQKLIHDVVRLRVWARETRMHVGFGGLNFQVEVQATAQGRGDEKSRRVICNRV